MPSETHSESRLFSLDVLRGLDMILLTVVGPLVNSAQDGWECLPGAFVMQFRHACWSGFTLWDIIMPLFIFMCGAAIPYALGKRLEKGRGVFWRHVLAASSCLCELTEKSVRNRSAAIDIPDFTRGGWRKAKPFGIVDIDVSKLDFTRVGQDNAALNV